MAGIKKDRILLYLAFSLAVLVAIGAGCGLFIEDTYKLETPNWRVQGIAQDMVDLFIITPILLLSAILAYRGNRFFFFCFGGTLLFLIYTYAIYCFSVHFNFLFPVYCFTFGLSVYSFIYFISVYSFSQVKEWFSDKAPVKAVSAFFILIAVLFYFLWLSEVLPAVFRQKTLATLIETGLLTNPVHVIDLSLVLPGMIIITVFLLKKKPIAFLFAPALLVFCLHMDINIAVLVLVMNSKGMGEGIPVAVLMFVLALISGILLRSFFSHLSRP